MQTELMQQLDVIASMAVAMLLGGSIGYERELKRRPAGFRTHMLVAGASRASSIAIATRAASP